MFGHNTHTSLLRNSLIVLALSNNDVLLIYATDLELIAVPDIAQLEVAMVCNWKP